MNRHREYLHVNTVTTELLNSLVNSSWLYGLKMKQGCSVVMGGSCKNRFRAQHLQMLCFTQRSELYYKTIHSSYQITRSVGVHLSVSHLLCWGGGIVLGGRSSLCPRALKDAWLDEVNKEAGLSVKVPMLETDGCVTESETGLTDTAEPAAAGEGDEREEICEKSPPSSVICVYVCVSLLRENEALWTRHLLSTDCDACIELKPFCKTNNEG